MLRFRWSSVCVAGVGLFGATFVSASEPIFVAIDDASIATVGAMPVSRAVYARAIDAARNAGAKATVLKFFLDAQRDRASDELLLRAAYHGVVIMQVESTGGWGREPIAPFVRDDWSLDGIQSPYVLGGVQPPFPALERVAAAVGFVSVRPGFDRSVEVAGRWRGKVVPSLQLETVELALGHLAKVSAGEIVVGARHVKLDKDGRVRCDVAAAPALKRYGIDQLLSRTIPPAEIEGRVVVLGYDRKDVPTVQFGATKVGVHEAFNRQVSCLFRTLSS